MVSPDSWAQRAPCQAETPPIVLCRFPEPALVSLSSRTAGRYLFLLVALLVAAVLFGYLASTANSLSSDITKLLESGNQLTNNIQIETDQLESKIGAKKFAEAGEERQKDISSLQIKLQQQNYLLDQVLEKTQVMSRVTSFGFLSLTFEPWPAPGFVDKQLS